jgi:hypothetical protein
MPFSEMRKPDVIATIVPVYYRAYPELVPFSNGDRAGMFGQETAEAFAKRKWWEYYHSAHGPGTGDARSARPRRRGPNPKGKRNYKPGSLA